jgi:hypothetical protein
MVEIWPVIHTRDLDQVLRCAETAVEKCCAGVVLISMHGDDHSLDAFAPQVIARFPSLKVGAS